MQKYFNLPSIAIAATTVVRCILACQLGEFFQIYPLIVGTTEKTWWHLANCT